LARIFAFFQNWLLVTDPPPLYQEVTGGRLIRERVSEYFAKGNRVVGWEPENSWGGDQGLLLGALADYKRQPHGTIKINIDWWLNALMSGVANSMSGTDGRYRYLMPWISKTNWFHFDEGDYSSGIGVYMRYLNYAYAFDPIVQKALNDNANAMHVLVLSSAQAVMADKLPSWGDGGFDYFNQLAILVMAISLSK
jgi:hypothetical protein